MLFINRNLPKKHGQLMDLGSSYLHLQNIETDELPAAYLYNKINQCGQENILYTYQYLIF